MHLQPYLMFDGRCEEAYEFYRNAVGAEAGMMMRYKDAPGSSEMTPPGSENKIMHMEFRIGDSLVLASDGYCKGAPSFQGFNLVINAKDETEAKKLFAALSAGGEVRMPLDKTFFSPCFGMLADKFGVGWFVIVRPQA
ncbi:MAG TPA: VOC family protein [Methylovirgula sp.]|jgi:PhnB protein|nr:VOC family protein [Methylovirgula sp.]